MKIQFLGATGTVTGSKYLVQSADESVLIDCGLFQGFKDLRLRNWKPLPLDMKKLKGVILTHAHIDHSGHLPLIVKQGFSGPIFCTPGTEALARILLPDAAHLQEEEARYANKRGYSKHQPALPLYTTEDAAEALTHLDAVNFGKSTKVGKDFRFSFSPAGHIIGSAFVRLEHGDTSVLFSGDIGRPNDPVMRAPSIPEEADYLVIESTYGDRRHADVDPRREMADAIKATVERGGVVLIPAFAVGRVQTLLHILSQLKAERLIPDVPVFLNSPMAIDATDIFCTFGKEHKLSGHECKEACRVATIIRSVEESKKLNERDGPMVIVSASGMLSGGRIVHHIKRFASDPKNMILFSGFQAAETRGALIAGGAEHVKIHGLEVPIRAQVKTITSLSAHADYEEILQWLRSFKWRPRRVFITHGEPDAADSLRQKIERGLGWECHVPHYLETFDMG